MQAHHETRDFARFLRCRLSLPEGLLWRAIKGRKADGLADKGIRTLRISASCILDDVDDAVRMIVTAARCGSEF